MEWVGLKFGSGDRRAGLGPAPTAKPKPSLVRRKGRSQTGPWETDRLHNQGHSPHPPPSGAPIPIPSVASRHHPLIRGVGPPGEGFWAADSRPYSPPETSGGAFQEPTLIRHGFAVPPSPWRGKARATARAAPTAESGPGALARQTQAQKRDRTKSRFCEPRAPVGPEGTAPKHS